MLIGRLFRTQLGILALLAATAVVWAGPQTAQESQRAQESVGFGERTQASASSRAGGGSFLGVHIWEVNAEVARKMKLADERGVIITSVVRGSAADEAGLAKGDVVLSFNQQRVEGVNQFIRLVREVPPGRECSFRIVRDGEEIDIEATMGDRHSKGVGRAGEVRTVRVPEVPMPRIVIPDVPHVYTTWRSVKLGVLAESLESQLAEYFGVESGVLVRSVAEDTSASRGGLKAGDVIVEVDGAAVETPREVSSALQERSGEEVKIVIVRERAKRTLMIDFSSE